jgi:uncharacterized protein with von Willebrand factor type A (vWA) domain
MKTRSFEVPTDMMPEFAEILQENELNNTIQGINDENDIMIDVDYEPDERDAVMELMLLLDPDDEDGSEENDD